MHKHRGIQVYFRDNRGIVIFMMLVVLAGVCSGALMVRMLDEGPMSELITSFNQFISVLKEDNSDVLSAPALLRSSLLKNGAAILLVWVLGLFPVGYIFILLILFLKGLSVGFTAGIIIYHFSLKGAIFCLAALFPHNLLIIPAYLISAAFAFAYSIYLFRNKYLRGKNEHPFLNSYMLYLCIVMLIAVLGALVEAFITPVFIRYAMQVL